jgi:LemA protein
LKTLNFQGYLIPVVVVAIIGVIGVYLAFLFNRLIKFDNAAEANLSQIRVAMKKRLDMIEQLLGAVKGYIRHEREVFETVSSMRTRIFEADASQLREIDRESRSISTNIMALAEAYPDLKANETVKKLMDAIVSVEDEIARHRYTYNNVVQVFNTMVESIPSNVIANVSGMEKMDYLQFDEEVEKRPDITGISEF